VSGRQPCPTGLVLVALGAAFCARESEAGARRARLYSRSGAARPAARRARTPRGPAPRARRPWPRRPGPRRPPRRRRHPPPRRRRRSLPRRRARRRARPLPGTPPLHRLQPGRVRVRVPAGHRPRVACRAKTCRPSQKKGSGSSAYTTCDMCADYTRAAGQRRTARMRRPRAPRARSPAGVQHDRLRAVARRVAHRAARRVAHRAARRGLRAQRRGPLVPQHAAQLLRAVAVARELLRLRVAARLRARGPPEPLPRSAPECLFSGARAPVLAQRQSRKERCPVRMARK